MLEWHVPRVGASGVWDESRPLLDGACTRCALIGMLWEMVWFEHFSGNSLRPEVPFYHTNNSTPRPGLPPRSDEAASCSEKAYERLKLADAQKLLLFDSEAAVKAYAQEVSVG